MRPPPPRFVLASSGARGRAPHLLALAALAGACRGGRSGELAFLPAEPIPSAQVPASTSPAGVANLPTEGSPSAPNTVLSPTPPAGDANAPIVLCGGNYRLCDDFESTPIGAPPDAALWAVETQNPTSKVVVDGTRFVAGTRSLHISTGNQGYERAVIVNTRALPAPNNSFFGRVYLFISPRVPMIHFDLMQAAGVLAGQSAPTSLNIGGQYGVFLDNYYDANDPAKVLDLWQHAGEQVNGAWTDATFVPEARWMCLEWHLAGPENLMEMWLDGQSVPSMTLAARSRDCCPDTVWTQPTFTSLALGWALVANQEAIDSFDIFLDGVAMDTQRIGCGR